MNAGGLLVVLPVLNQAIAEPCIDSLLRKDSSAGFDPKDILIVDNTKEGIDRQLTLPFCQYRDPDGHNLGVARSWNWGAKQVIDAEMDYVVLMSAVMEFGPELHTTFVKEMEKFWGENVIECEGHSWHLIAIHRRVFEAVGLFDPAYYPAYFEAVDFGYRMRLAGLEYGFRHVWVNAMSRGVALHNQIVSTPAKPLLAYYHRKWGSEKGEEKFEHPFNDPRNGLDYFDEEPIPMLAERYELEEWW